MSSYKNNVHLEGNLGKDAEKKATPYGDVVKFSIAVNEQWEDKDGAEHKNTDWFQIQVWGPLAKFAATLKAGTPVMDVLSTTHRADIAKKAIADALREGLLNAAQASGLRKRVSRTTDALSLVRNGSRVKSNGSSTS